jgi:uracil-DNA glycosylase
MKMKIEAGWHEVLRDEIGLPYVAELKRFLREEQEAGAKIYPPEGLVFHAFLKTPFAKVKVVVIGQDPYHGAGQAHGLSFSVMPGVLPPPSLKNIFKEMQDDVGGGIPLHGCLDGWAEQGVLLLNATLTVRDGDPKSHYGKGWERFTDAVVRKLWMREDPLVFMLWGKSAQEKLAGMEGKEGGRHRVLVAAHPSPYSAYAGFFGCRHFSKANEALREWGKEEINWSSL